MEEFRAALQRFDGQGEKTGWTYIDIPAEVAEALKPGCRTSYRVRGAIDLHPIQGVSLVPMGRGQFILAVNASMRKALKKGKGAQVQVKLEVDDDVWTVPAYVLECLADEPMADALFRKLPPSHQRHYVRWIEEAKTDTTRTKRLLRMIDGLNHGLDFGETLRAQKEKNKSGQQD